MFNVSIRDGRPTLGTQMKSVGEVMAIGRTFKEALWKGMRSLETGKAFGSEKFDKALVTARLITPTPDRLNYIRYAMANGYGVQDIHELTSIDPWFLEQIKEVVDFERDLANAPQEKEVFRQAKRYGISDVQLAKTWGADEMAVRQRRKALGVGAVFSRVDTCAAEFESFTPYLYSCYESSCEAAPGAGKKVMISDLQGLGGRRRVQPGGHLRGGVRKLHAVPLLLLRKLLRGGPGRGEEGHDFRSARPWGSAPCSAGWTPARRSSKASRRTSTPVTKAPARRPRARGRRS